MIQKPDLCAPWGQEDPLNTQKTKCRRLRATCVRLAFVAAGLVLAGCASAPPTSVPAGPAVSPREEGRALALFQERASQFRQAAEHRLGTVGSRLLAAMELPSSGSFVVQDSDEVNAYARGGQVYVTLGMLRFVKSDDELALVVGHELGHFVVARQAGTGGISPKDLERSADYHGLVGLHRAGYDIVAACEVWQRMATERALQRSGGQAQGQTRWSASHPSFAERYVRAHKLAESLLDGDPPFMPPSRPAAAPSTSQATHSLRSP